MANGSAHPSPLGKVLGKIPRFAIIVSAVIFLLLLVAVIASFFVDEPLRRYTELQVNKNLQGYTVRIGKLSLHPLTLSITLGDLSVTREKHPDPPVARFKRIHTGIQWGSILSGMLVAEMEVERPVLHVNLDQIREEAKAPEPAVRKKRWQQAVQALYPLKVNTFEIRDADLTYTDEDLKKALRVTRLNIGISNVRNRPSPKNQFPSPIHIDAVVFDTGKATIRGSVNFLAEPLPTGKLDFEASDIHLAYFRPIAARAKVALTGGVLSLKGNVQSSPKEKVANIDFLKIDKLKADYIQEGITEGTKKKPKETPKEQLAKVQKPGVLLRVGRLELNDAELGFINRQAAPTYRVYMAGTDLLLSNLSNKFSHGPATLGITGKFMGSGATKVTATFRPETTGPDFDIDIAISGADMRGMNNLLRAYGNFDVVAGKFSFYSQLHLKNDRITGYVKPLFREMNVYDRRQDKQKSLFRKMYEGLVGGVAGLLENRRREAVATKTDITGPVEEPKADTWQAVGNLLRNAFTRAILPGFEEEVRRGGK